MCLLAYLLLLSILEQYASWCPSDVIKGSIQTDTGSKPLRGNPPSTEPSRSDFLNQGSQSRRAFECFPEPVFIDLNQRRLKSIVRAPLTSISFGSGFLKPNPEPSQLLLTSPKCLAWVCFCSHSHRWAFCCGFHWEPFHSSALCVYKPHHFKWDTQ